MIPNEVIHSYDKFNTTMVKEKYGYNIGYRVKVPGSPTQLIADGRQAKNLYTTEQRLEIKQQIQESIEYLLDTYKPQTIVAKFTPGLQYNQRYLDSERLVLERSYKRTDEFVENDQLVMIYERVQQ